MKTIFFILSILYFSNSFGQTTSKDTIPQFFRVKTNMVNDTLVFKKYYDIKSELFISEISYYYPESTKTGTWKTYYLNGLLKSIGEYANNKKIGEWKWYHENGQISQLGYFDKDGEATGQWYEYNEDGEETYNANWWIKY